eukprot:c44489_g1_i1 orf=28-180(-)
MFLFPRRFWVAVTEPLNQPNGYLYCVKWDMRKLDHPCSLVNSELTTHHTL